MPDKKILLLNDEVPDTYKMAIDYMENRGWVKDPEIPYNPYGTEKIKLLHLVLYAEGELPESEITKLDKHEGIIQSVMVPWPRASTLEELEEATKHLMNVLLGERGWEMLEHYSKDARLVLRTTPVEVAARPVVPVLEEPEEAEAEVEVEPAAEVEAPVLGEPLKEDAVITNYVETGKASDAEAVAEVEEAGEEDIVVVEEPHTEESEVEPIEAEEAPVEEAPAEETPVEEPAPVEEAEAESAEVEGDLVEVPFNKEDLGCDWCIRDTGKKCCTDLIRQTHFNVMKTTKRSYQCGLFENAGVE